MKKIAKMALPLIGAATLSLGACESYFKAHEDFRHYSAETAKVHADTASFRKGHRPPVNDSFKLHLSNFDTFVCDGARQLVANFDREENTVSISFNGRNKFLTRDNPLYPFTDSIYDLFVMEDGTLLVQKDGGTIFQHCRPLVADSMKSQVYQSGDPALPYGAAPVARYEYTPTITPEEYRSAEPAFNNKMNK